MGEGGQKLRDVPVLTRGTGRMALAWPVPARHDRIN